MPVPAWDDLDSFLSLDDFAVTATPDGGQAFALIVEEQYFSAELGTYDMNTSDPWATAKASDVVGLKKRSRLTIKQNSLPYGVFWLTHDPKPDGTGMATLRLSRSQNGS
ncbi:head-tail joining protein [Asaia astilbis]|uniref:head-tail joining protein n=1 Tax=Asaia astilbis TaxID=610244 RepID=UPI000470F4F0|nr:hypothetical protein [Asaia astilbis]